MARFSTASQANAADEEIDNAVVIDVIMTQRHDAVRVARVTACRRAEHACRPELAAMSPVPRSTTDRRTDAVDTALTKPIRAKTMARVVRRRCDAVTKSCRCSM